MVNFIESGKFRKTVLEVGGLLFILTAFFNLGIIAIDDYAFVISQTIPAQANTADAILKNTGLWHPISPFLLHSISSVAYSLGLVDPYNQLQFVLVFLAIITFAVQSKLLPKFFESKLEQNIVLALFALFFVSPLLFTRPMVESLSAPILLLSCYYAHLYFKNGKKTDLISSALILSIGSLVRYQLGICGIALFFLVGIRKSLKDLFLLGISFLVGFLISGGIDYLLTGEFHGSLRGYLHYNLNYNSTHGHQPFYVFILLFFALTFPPTLFFKYKDFSWTETYRKLLVPLSYFIVFVLVHTLTPHKEERFMIPVLPLFFICITPLFAELIRAGKTKRLVYFVSLNGVLLLITSFSTPQSNILGLVRYLDQSPNVAKIYSWGDTLVLFPSAFSNKPLNQEEVSPTNFEPIKNLNCNEAIAIREAYKSSLPVPLENLTLLASFAPGPLEALIVKLNPIRNARRGTIEVFGKKGCE